MKATKVNKILLRRGVTGKEAAEVIGIPPVRFYKVVNDHDKTPWVRKAIADYLGVEARKLWKDYEEKEASCSRNTK